MERLSHPLTRRSLLVGSVATALLHTKKEVFASLLPRPEFQSPVLEIGDVVQEPNGKTYLVKNEIHDGKTMRVRYAISEERRLRHRGKIRLLHPIHIESIPQREPPEGEGRREDPIFIFIPGIKTDEFAQTFEAIKDTLRKEEYSETNFYNFTHKTKEESIRDPNIIFNEMDGELHALKKRFPLRTIWLVGHSLGGFLAHKLAMEHYDSVIGVVSLDGALMGVNPTPLPVLLERQIAESPLIAGASGKFFVEQGADPTVEQRVKDEVKFLQEKGVLYVTFASTEDRLIDTKLSFVESSDNTFLGRKIDLVFPMGRFLDVETIIVMIDNVEGGLEQDLTKDMVWHMSKDGVFPSYLLSEIIESISQFGIFEDWGERIELLQRLSERKPFYSHTIVASHPKVLESIPRIIGEGFAPQKPRIINEVQLDFRGILPGFHKPQDIRRLLGRPIKTVREGRLTVLFYPTESEYLFNRVLLDDTVRYIIQEMNSLADSPYQYLQSLSPSGPDGFLYERDENLFWWHVFARHGVAFFANEDVEALTVMYFPPMSFEEFRRTIAKDFNLADEPPKSGF